MDPTDLTGAMTAHDDSRTTRILWRSDELESLERFSGGPSVGGWRFRGMAVLPIDGEPAQISYRLELDPLWRTRRAELAIEAERRTQHIVVVADGEGTWNVEGIDAEPLDGCIDIDLGFSPATNTLQIRRLGLQPGESHTLPVAWLMFPELTLQPLDQTYTHLGPDRWQYASKGFTAELAVDSGGYVLRYGDDLWKAVAHRSD
jgi:hypothetical protein